MKLNETEVNDYLRPLIGRREDSFQQVWVEILERDPNTLEEITPIIRRVRNKAIKEYMNRKYREESLYKPIGKNGDETFTLESVLASPETGEDAEDEKEEGHGLYQKIINFLMGEYFNQRNQNLELKGRDIELKAERLRLRTEILRFKKDRFESWKKLMENKTIQKEKQFRLRVRLQREKLRFRKEQLYLKERNPPLRHPLKRRRNKEASRPVLSRPRVDRV
jgi:hypothetical protein